MGALPTTRDCTEDKSVCGPWGSALKGRKVLHLFVTCTLSGVWVGAGGLRVDDSHRSRRSQQSPHLIPVSMSSPFRFKERVLQTPNDLLAAGFEEHKFQNFFNAFYSVVELVEKDGSVSSLLKVFNDQSSSDRIVQFLRLLTSAFIRNRADFFRHFIDEEMDIRDFCTHEVEPMAMECDHIQITALSQALNIALQVEYVDEMDTALNHHVFPEAAIPSVYLLYKTSHYNILYAADKR
ncbi:ubiquitin thioesterase OTUB2 isoform X1 [Phacochoerus africanus]|uniref:ubiquitin thioesterase OTUB2 isoform X1 n=1 Tax=Phacochoerus africanus TaxID=41426 RepID=UPI001FD99273|nr:ubiquitin thioesterase OTUB2 isoform X1 [Phacochoerus africanus]